MAYKVLDELTLADLEAIRLLLRGGSVIDWHRLNFRSEEEAAAFLRAQELDLGDAADVNRSETIKNSAISYLKRNYDFPIPKPVAQASVSKLLMIAASRGHRQLCACTILKVMHIIHHLEARELLFMLPVSDQEVFHLVEQKVYRVIGGMLAHGLPILEFIGGRKNKDSLYTKLLSKQETVAAQIYDKLRFRIVTRTPDDIFPTLNYLMEEVFPFNYIIPNESTNTLFNFRSYCEANPHLGTMTDLLQLSPDLEEAETLVDNRFTAPSYQVVHFVVDMPVRLPNTMLDSAPPAAWALGRVIFVQTEFQVIDRETEQKNEMGEASHASYKDRQKLAVMRRLKVGNEEQAVHQRRSRLPRPPRPSRPPKPPNRPSRPPKAPKKTKGSK
ncbi:MAG: TIGR04552 family protein [Myxococcota bacterium]